MSGNSDNNNNWLQNLLNVVGADDGTNNHQIPHTKTAAGGHVRSTLPDMTLSQQSVPSQQYQHQIQTLQQQVPITTQLHQSPTMQHQNADLLTSLQQLQQRQDELMLQQQLQLLQSQQQYHPQQQEMLRFVQGRHDHYLSQQQQHQQVATNTNNDHFMNYMINSTARTQNSAAASAQGMLMPEAILSSSVGSGDAPPLLDQDDHNFAAADESSREYDRRRKKSTSSTGSAKRSSSRGSGRKSSWLDPSTVASASASTDIAGISQEMNELTVEERTKIQEEVHGVVKVDMPMETPEFVEAKIQELLDAVEHKVPRLKRKFYDKAVFLKPSIVDDTKFQLMFLRADRYDATKAARAMCLYFQSKVKLFGAHTICRRITLDDMSDDDLECFHTGGIVPLPAKDSSGRFVFWANMNNYGFRHWTNWIRYLWYQCMICVQDDDEAQLNGMVNVFYFHKQSRSHQQDGENIDIQTPRTQIDSATTIPSSNVSPPSNRSSEIFPSSTGTPLLHGGTASGTSAVPRPSLLSTEYMDMLTQGAFPMINDLPFRMVGFHICYDDPKVHPLINLCLMGMGKDTRLRFRAHYGSPMESKYALMQFGVPIHAVPFDEDEPSSEQGSKASSPKNNKSATSNNNDTQESPPKTLKKYIPWSLSERRRIEKEERIKREQLEKGKGGQASSDDIDSSTTNVIIPYPSEHDVLLGRGRPYQEWSGNVHLVKLVDEVRDQYLEATDRFDKTLLTMDIVAKVQADGGRFLQRLDGTKVKGWQQVPNDVARDKVSHTFRTKKATVSSGSSSSSKNVSSSDCPTNQASDILGIEQMNNRIVISNSNLEDTSKGEIPTTTFKFPRL